MGFGEKTDTIIIKNVKLRHTNEENVNNEQIIFKV